MLGGYQGMWFSTAILAGLTVFGPLALLAVLRGLMTRDRSRAALAGAAMGMAILGSHPQHAVLFFCSCSAGSRRPPPARPNSGASPALRGTVPALLDRRRLRGHPHALDTIENGYRDPEFDRLSLYGSPWLLATHAAGLLVGKAYFPGPGVEAEFATFAGLAALALAVAAPSGRGPTRESASRPSREPSRSASPSSIRSPGCS
jgi:hypothetical protein